MITFLGVRKGFQGEILFQDLSFSIEEGETWVIQGPNGSGKSTLLKLIAGILLPDEGTIHMKTNRIGIIGHANHLLFERTVRKNLEHFSRLFHSPQLPPGDPFRISPLLDRSVRTLSQGQRRRVALSRIFAWDPDLYLLDEPEAGLDEEGRTILYNLLRDVVRRGRTLLWATHEPLERIRPLFPREIQVLKLPSRETIFLEPLPSSLSLP